MNDFEEIIEDTNPLWLPRGSVRALLTLILVGTVCALVVMEREIPEWFQLTFAGVVGGYFVSRAVQPRVVTTATVAAPPAPVVPPTPDIESADLLRRTVPTESKSVIKP